MKKIFLLPAVLLLLILSLQSVSAIGLFVFEEYSTSYFVKGRTMVVEKEIVLRNIGSNVVIPGEMFFEISEQHGGNFRPATVRDSIALSGSTELVSRITEHTEHTDVSVQIWNPILPGFDYTFSLSYEMDFRPQGVFFHEVVFPVERMRESIDVRNRNTRMMLPTRYSITYAPSADVSSDGLYKIVDWGSRTDLTLEYSVLPMPELMPFRMVSVFWLTVLVLLGALFIFLNLKRTKKSKKK